jgi:hypothetical protein
MLFAAMVHFDEGVSLETLLTLHEKKSLIFLVGTRRPALSMIEQVDFVLETLTRNRASRCRSAKKAIQNLIIRVTKLKLTLGLFN